MSSEDRITEGHETQRMEENDDGVYNMWKADAKCVTKETYANTTSEKHIRRNIEVRMPTDKYNWENISCKEFRERERQSVSSTRVYRRGKR